MAMTVELPALAQTEPMAPRAPSGRLRRWTRPALGLLLPVGLALGWELIVGLGLSSGRLVPPPTRIFATILELARSGELARHIMATLSRVGAGFGLGVIAGTVLGAVSGYWDLARRLLDPTVQALRAIPSLAWPAMIRRILLPAVLPAYVVALRVGLGLGWMFVVAAELMGASEGLGYLLLDGQQLGKPAQILAAIVIFAIVGKTTDWLIEIGTAPLLRWQDAFGRQSGAA